MKIGITQIEAIREALLALPPAPKMPNDGTKRESSQRSLPNCSTSAARDTGWRHSRPF